ncbi:hypothetical protein OHA18_22895 [Kribbella sp. NBC_00709]|uniref:hypothetical protein n=1 Tax=Kribbella sp. NBC_00709 TaxID=2975972 RepID=UPI002E2D28B8|nr:hypothetical protein [Kribbella sp. NBC_00709]
MSTTKTSTPKDNRDYAWHRHPAFIAGIPAAAAIIGSILTIVLGQAGALPQSINPAPPTATVTSIATTTATVTSSVTNTEQTDGPSTAPGSQAVVWHRQLHLPDRDGLDIDQAQPNVTDGVGTEFSVGMFYGGEYPFVQLHSTVGGIASSSAPTHDQCVDAINTNHTQNDFAVLKGKTFCVKEDPANNPAGARLAAIRVVSTKKDPYDMLVDVTVWTLD